MAAVGEEMASAVRAPCQSVAMADGCLLLPAAAPAALSSASSSRLVPRTCPASTTLGRTSTKSWSRLPRLVHVMHLPLRESHLGDRSPESDCLFFFDLSGGHRFPCLYKVGRSTYFGECTHCSNICTSLDFRAKM